jgi:putative iron-dependent peroxidase
MKDTLLYQPGILEGVPAVARYVLFNLAEAPTQARSRAALKRLSPLANGSDVVLGIGPALVAALGAQVPGLHEFPDLSGHGVKVPSTPGTLWCWCAAKTWAICCT